MSERKGVVLQVDDDEANRYAVTRSLRKAGFEVIEATSGQEALRRAAENPDLVILDVRLPDIDGFEVCRRLKSNPATNRIPVLHLSASFTTSDDRAHGLESGADGYLVRPVEPVELVATVTALLRARRSEEALRQSEDRYRQIIENVADFAIFTIDPKGIVTSWNIGAQRLLGFTDEEIIGKPVSIIFIPEDRESNAPSDELAKAAANGRAPDERWHERRDGSRFYASGVVTSMRDASGALIGFSKLMQDVTHQRLAEEQLRKSKEQAERAQAAAEQANRLKDEFLATLSHELRTPLNAIVGWSQLLRSGRSTDKALDPELLEGLETIERNAKVQAQLIEDLLDVSRIISGKLRLDVQRVEMHAVIGAAIASVAPAAEAKSIQLVRLLEPKGAVVWGDPARLQQVIWNLLSNAIKFTPREGRVQVALQAGEGHVQLSVTDTGAGIAPAFLPHVFERFRQADPSTRRVQGGLGLGLAIVKQLVELHGGSVWAQSEGEHRGATFTVSIPIYTPTVAPSERPASRNILSDYAGCPPNLLEGVHILIVEDERDSRILQQRILSACGATVQIAASVQEALQTIQQHRFDLLISDIGMPGEDGFDLIQKVRSLPESKGGNMPAIALTAFASQDDQTRALRYGFQQHITKPADAGELINAVARLTSRSPPSP